MALRCGKQQPGEGVKVKGVVKGVKGTVPTRGTVPKQSPTTQRGYTRNPEAEGGIGGIIALKNNTVTRAYAALALLPGEQVNEEDVKVAEPQAVKAVSPYYYFYDGQGSVEIMGTRKKHLYSPI